MTDMQIFHSACKQTLVHGNPTDLWMNDERVPNGRYLTDKKLCEDPYSEVALLHGEREIRDDKPLQNQTARRFAAPKFLESEIALQKEAETCTAEGLAEGEKWWVRIKTVRGTSNIDKLPKKDVLWNFLC